MIVLEIILKVLLYVFLLLLILCLVICLSSVVLKISFWDGKFTWRVCYFGFQILPFRKKEKKSRKKITGKARKNKKTKKTENEKKLNMIQDTESEANSEANFENFDEKSASESVTETESKPESEPEPEKKQVFKMDQKLKSFQKFVSGMDTAGNVCAAVPGTLRLLARAAKWCDIRTDIVIGGEDAYICARNYGIMQAAIQNLLAQMSKKIIVKRKKISISCDFTQDESKYQFQFSFQLHVGKTVLAVIYFLLMYFWDKHKVKTSVSGAKL